MRILIALLALMPFGAHAACPVGSQAVQSCSFSDGRKGLDVCLVGETVTYAFGKTGKTPDLHLSAPVTQVGYVPWNGVGRSIYEEIRFHNKGITYLVWYAVDRLVDTHPVSGGIVVSQGNQELASLSCDENSVSAEFGALYDRMMALGHCWNYETHAWGGCN